VDSRSKKKKLNTPVKTKDTRRPLFENVDQPEQESSTATDVELEDDPSEAGTATYIDIEDESNQSATATDIGIEDEPSDTDLSESLDELKRRLPDVLANLQAEDQLETYLKFNSLVAANKFPVKNICYLLFMDLVEWFSCLINTRLLWFASL
jgi:hypothetical protein